MPVSPVDRIRLRRIVGAARDLFEANGFEATTTAQISGVTVNSTVSDSPGPTSIRSKASSDARGTRVSASSADT